MAWTKANIKKLKDMVADKKSANQIADVLDKSRNAVCGKAHRLGLVFDSLVRVKNRPVLKSDRAVLAQIRKHTDHWGWGLEFSEIVEYTGFASMTVLQSIRSLLSSKHINKSVSYVADHVFFNDNSVRQA